MNVIDALLLLLILLAFALAAGVYAYRAVKPEADDDHHFE